MGLSGNRLGDILHHSFSFTSFLLSLPRQSQALFFFFYRSTYYFLSFVQPIAAMLHDYHSHFTLLNLFCTKCFSVPVYGAQIEWITTKHEIYFMTFLFHLPFFPPFAESSHPVDPFVCPSCLHSCGIELAHPSSFPCVFSRHSIPSFILVSLQSGLSSIQSNGGRCWYVTSC